SAARGVAASSSGVVHLDHCAFWGLNGPASWPAAVLLRRLWFPRCTLPGPTRTPACMHEEETGLPRRGALGISTAEVMRLHSSQVPGCFGAPPLPHAHSRLDPGEG
ncbi:hypothetical protein M9458_043076, partial [Cirrhinus mrigala]